MNQTEHLNLNQAGRIKQDYRQDFGRSAGSTDSAESATQPTLAGQLANIRAGLMDLISNQNQTGEQFTGPTPVDAAKELRVDPPSIDYLVEQISVLVEKAIGNAVRLRQRIGG